MRTCQHRQSRQRRQPPPTLTKHSTPKVAGNSPLPISYDEIISLKFRHFQHMIEHSIIELHAKLQGAHRTTAPYSATSSARASPTATGSPGTLTWNYHNTPECMTQPRPRPWMKRGRGRGRVERSRAQGAPVVQPTRRMCPEAVSDQPAATTIREIRPSR